MKRIIGYFFQGLLFVVPVAVTVYIFYYVVATIDRLMGDLIPPLRVAFVGAGFVAMLALVTVIGFLASNIVTSRILGLVDWVFTKLPLVKLLYSSIKDLIDAFVGDKKSFNKPVVVTLAPGGPKVVGFVTNECLDSLGLQDHVSVYIPQSYNFCGNLLVFPKDQVSPIAAESSQVMAFLVSGGVSGKQQESGRKES